jgi:peptidoglycan hydrolase-like protein with peptidoglycan-binding domain
LNPIDTVSGIKQRLNNLGYHCGDESEEETDAVLEAVLQFQKDNGLKETGEFDDATRAKLESLHK